MLSYGLLKRINKYGTEEVDHDITLDAVMDKHNNWCQQCGTAVGKIHPPQSNSASIEHIVPLSEGGSHTWDNVTLFCYECNVNENERRIKEREVKTAFERLEDDELTWTEVSKAQHNRGQVGGKHYQLPIEPIDFIVRNAIPYREGNVIKYVVRYRNKNGLEDLKKARHYIDMLIEEYE